MNHMMFLKCVRAAHGIYLRRARRAIYAFRLQRHASIMFWDVRMCLRLVWRTTFYK